MCCVPGMKEQPYAGGRGKEHPAMVTCGRAVVHCDVSPWSRALADNPGATHDAEARRIRKRTRPSRSEYVPRQQPRDPDATSYMQNALSGRILVTAAVLRDNGYAVCY